MDANQRLALIVLRHKLDVDRYGRGTLRDIYKVLKTSEDNLVREVAVRYEKIQSSGKDAGPAKTKAVEDLIEQTRAIAKVYEDRLNGSLTDNLIGLARNEYEATAKSLNAVGFLDVKPKVPEASKLASIVASTPFKSTPDRAHMLSSWTRHMSDDLSQKVEGLIRNGLVENKTVAEIARAIRGTKDRKGVMDISRRSAETLVRTAVATIQTDIALDSYRASGVVTHVRWQSVFDSRTSEICQARDGREWAIDDRGLQRPPAHPNCRSQLVPITKKFRDLGLDRDEAPEDDRDYEAYIKDAGEGVQNEVFGVKRAQLFRDGKITFRELFNNDDQYYTLDQLRARHPNAFEAQGKAKETAKTPTAAVIDIAALDAAERDYVLKLGREQNREHLTAYDAKTGETIERSGGTVDQVVFSDRLVAALDDSRNEIVLHHNHPSSSSFSHQDLKMLRQFRGMGAIFAHGHNGSLYRAERGERILDDKTVSAVGEPIKTKMWAAIRNEGVTPVEASLIYNHLIWTRMAQLGQLVYSFELSGESLRVWKKYRSLFERILEDIK